LDDGGYDFPDEIWILESQTVDRPDSEFFHIFACAVRDTIGSEKSGFSFFTD